MIYVLILICSHVGASCQQPEVAPSFENKDLCEQLATQFNSDPVNKKAGDTERCLLVEPTGR